MPTGIAVSAIVVGVLGALVTAGYFRTARKTKMDRLASRPGQTSHDIYRQFFSDGPIPEERVVELWEELARVLELPAGKLLPTDRFEVELAPPKGYDFDDPIKDVRYLISRNCLDKGIDPKSIQTVRDYIVSFG